MLTYWRRRLAVSARPDRIFDAVREVVAATGALTGKTRRALDSTVLEDAVATQDTVTQLIAAIRRVRREVPGAAAVIAAQCTAHDYDDPGKPAIAWNDPDARAAAGGRAGRRRAPAARSPARAGLGPRAAEAVALLALVAGQDVEPVEGGDGTDGRWQIARRVAPDRVISTVDPDARHAHKTVHRRTDGFNAHVVVEPDTGLITATRLTKAGRPGQRRRHRRVALLAGDDSHRRAGAGARRLRLRHRRRARRPRRGRPHGGDQALAAAPGHARRVHPRRLPRRRGRRHRDLPGRGHPADQPHPVGHLRRGLPRLPAAGPLHHRRRGRSLHLHPHDALQRAHRARAADPDFQADYRRHRPMVERTIAWLTRGHRRVPYRGVIKNDAWLHLRVAAINLRRLLTLGLTGTDGHWALAS